MLLNMYKRKNKLYVSGNYFDIDEYSRSKNANHDRISSLSCSKIFLEINPQSARIIPLQTGYLAKNFTRCTHGIESLQLQLFEKPFSLDVLDHMIGIF